MDSHIIRTTALAAVLIPALALTSCHKKKADTDAEGTMEVSVALPEVDTVTLTKTYPGHLISQSTVDLVARVDGYLREKCYKSGQYVTKGQVLFRIEDTQYRDAVNQAEAQLRTAQSTYEYDARNYEAMKKALESDAVARISVIQAESDMKNAQAAIKNAQAALETARTNLSYCVVRAPFNGHVTASGPDPGAYLSGAGSPVTLATIYDDSRLDAQFNVEDAEYIKMMQRNIKDLGLNFSAVPLAFTDTLPHSYTGDLSYIAPDIDPSTGTMVMRAAVKNDYGELKDGMYVTVTLPYERIANAILIKDSAISTDQAGKYVYVVNDSNQVIYTPITISGMANDSMRVVTDGLTPQSRYVTQALLKVRDGMKVKPIMPGSSNAKQAAQPKTTAQTTKAAPAKK